MIPDHTERKPLITLRHYTISDSIIEYEPKDYMGNLDWFHLAECARKRMSQHCQDIPRWRGERRSFYSSLSKMYEVNFQD